MASLETEEVHSQWSPNIAQPISYAYSHTPCAADQDSEMRSDTAVVGHEGGQVR